MKRSWAHRQGTLSHPVLQAALLAEQGSQLRTARRLAIPASTLSKFVAAFGLRAFAKGLRGPRTPPRATPRPVPRKATPLLGRHTKLMGLTPNLGNPDVAMPARPMPTRCGKCGADACGFIAHPDQPEVTCRMCGWEVLVRPVGGFTDRHLAHRVLGIGAA